MKTIEIINITALARLALASIQQPLADPLSHNAIVNPSTESALDQIITSSPLLAFHRHIVTIESISENEQEVGDFIIDFLSSHNLTVEKQVVTPKTDATKERFNIYAYAGDNRFPEILLTSHIDTVPPFIPYSLHPPGPSPHTGKFDRKDLLIAGRGTVDAKASVAALVLAVLDTLATDPTASVGILLDVGEEKSGVGMKHFSASELNPTPSSFHTVIFGEPTNGDLVKGHKGTLGFKVVARGKPAHSSYPWLGQSAILSILPVLEHINSLQYIAPEEGGLLWGEVLGNSTLNIGTIGGGEAANVVPAHAEATVSVRLAAGSPEETRRIIQAAVDELTGGDGSVLLDFGGGSGNGTVGAPPQFFETGVEGFEVIAVNYGTDAFSLEIHDHGATRKVKRYLYGPGRFEVTHGEKEAITVRELEDAVEGYKRLIAASL
ncbi:Zn-dependent exopeptidase [Aspergillus fijiensis CBS 313.89]|uniref:Zn-dependent exopeptidase n=1 Tax=Aspergillus fijiensis CBS 313.89 TaxID=1448319 RepID=A0A8G1RRZ7_9EURO|nr:Zn-dependent exopeptidase [Aspergillus fijiensis CBS 313.89]RAK77213.1 Zn-dependent exopeptidase [Aspergillus fijiensis CBS 313.89]